MSLSNSMETKALKWLFKLEADESNSSLRPTAWYVALCTSDPTDTALGTEVSNSGTAYARQAVTFTVSGNNASNSADIEFPEATGSGFGTVQAVMIMPASTGGDASAMIAHAQLSVDKQINSGDIFRIPAGDLDINID
jgi:hypothetical protein